ncbi:Dabb family protein [Rubritalea spongiae]|uniref:Dabb family protein n=1 Tax=Rubritalea spongiae TaxID=430797 RepID=A0ABW5E3Z2_9BACT
MKKLLTLLISLFMFQWAAADSPYRHVVLLKFKDDASKEQITTIEKHFINLKDKIDTIQDIEWGINDVSSTRGDGFTHCFFVTFENKAGLDAYSPHPEHQKFVTELKKVLDKVLVVDYTAQ